MSRPAVSQHLKVLKEAGLVLDQPARDLVKQQHARFGRQCPRQLEPLLVDIGELSGGSVGLAVESDPRQQRLAPLVGGSAG